MTTTRASRTESSYRCRITSRPVTHFTIGSVTCRSFFVFSSRQWCIHGWHDAPIGLLGWAQLIVRLQPASWCLCRRDSGIRLTILAYTHNTISQWSTALHQQLGDGYSTEESHTKMRNQHH